MITPRIVDRTVTSIPCSSIFSLLVVITTLFILFSPSYCLTTSMQAQDTFKGNLVVEEKTRLGSTPPTCHNKCNQCHPCIATQVPTIPGHEQRFDSGSVRVISPLDYYGSIGNRYSNYKPLGWKCRCGGHFYNP